MTDVLDVDGAPAAIRAAILATGGIGNVVLKPGNFPWNGETVNVPNGINILTTGWAGCSSHPNWTLYPAPTILHNNSNTANPMFSATETTNTRLSGMQVEAPAPASPSAERSLLVHFTRCKNFRVDHCSLINFGEVGIFNDLNWSAGTSAYGLIDHCYLAQPYKASGSGWLYGYGVQSIGAMDLGKGAWDTDLSHFVGKYADVLNMAMAYIEDCRFNYNRHCTSGLQGGWHAIRYCLSEHNFPNYGSLDMHGSQGDEYYGARGMEAYFNTLHTVVGQDEYGTDNNAAIRLRGGMGIFFGNTIIGEDPASFGIQLDDYDCVNYGCTGARWPFTNIHNTYLWNNPSSNCIPFYPRQGVENTDYFRRAPTAAELPTSGYAGLSYIDAINVHGHPYPYPHPLTLADLPQFQLSINANVKANFQLDKIA